MEQRTVDLGGPVHYADFGGPQQGPPIVLVHGLGGSHANWLAVGPKLALLGRVFALDLAGHGRTGSLGQSAKIHDNQALLGRFIAKVAGPKAVVMGNSMGGYLALRLAADEPGKVSALVLVDPALPRAPGARIDSKVLALFAGLAVPGLGALILKRRARGGPEEGMRRILELCCVDPSRIPRDVYEAHLQLARERERQGEAVLKDFLDAARSLIAALFHRPQFFEMVARVQARTLIVQGAQDRLVPLASARALAAARPDWQLEVLEGVGHIPQLEAPERFLALVEPFLRRAPLV